MYDYKKFNFSPEMRAKLGIRASLGDITPYNDGAFGIAGAVIHQVVSGGTPPAINAGEMVLKTLGNEYVIPMATNKPVVATDFVAGISTTTSTETATVAGTVAVTPITPGQIYLIAPKVAATWNTQAKYNALVGARVLIDVTSGVETILATDGSTSGCVIENLDIVRFPGKVAFSIRAGASYLA